MSYLLEHLFTIASVYSMTALSVSMLVMARTLFSIVAESQVNDRLKKLRHLLLIDGVTTFLLTAVALTIIGARYALELESLRNFSYALLMIFSTIVLIKTVVKYLIYTLRYE